MGSQNTQSTRKLAGIAVGVVVIGAVAVAGLAVRSLLSETPEQAGAGEVVQTAPGTGETKIVAAQGELEKLLSAIQVYVRDGEYGKADAIFEESVQKFVDDQDLRIAYAEFLTTQQRIQDAYNQYEAALAIGPREAPIEFSAGYLASVLRMDVRAEEHFAAAQATDPTRAEYALHLANARLRLGKKAEATADLVRAGVLNPDEALVWGTLAKIELDDNKLELARKHVDMAREIQPREPAWAIIEARIVKREGDPESALRILTALSETDQKRADAVKTIAECYGMIGRPEDAAATYVNASDSAPGDATLAFEASLALERIGDTEGAITYANRAEQAGHRGAPRLLARLTSGG